MYRPRLPASLTERFFRTRTHNAQTATIYLGAASTIIAGLLTYFKSRNQPNRARQFRQALRGVRNRIDDSVGDLQYCTPDEARQIAKEIMKKYKDALKEAETNYPDEWMTLADLSRFLPGKDLKDDSEAKTGEARGDENHKANHHHHQQSAAQDLTTTPNGILDTKTVSSASEIEPTKPSPIHSS